MVMSQDQNAGCSHNIKSENSYFERVVGNNLKKSKFYSGRNLGQTKAMGCLLSFGAESFVFQ